MMFKLKLEGHDQSKVVACDSIEDARIAYTKALQETFRSIINGCIYSCYWQTWKLFKDYEIYPYKLGRFPHKEDTLCILSYHEFVRAVSDTGYGVMDYDVGGSADIISFSRTGDKCFAAHSSQNFNQYVPWNVAYQMYVEFLERIVK